MRINFFNRYDMNRQPPAPLSHSAATINSKFINSGCLSCGFVIKMCFSSNNTHSGRNSMFLIAIASDKAQTAVKFQLETHYVVI